MSCKMEGYGTCMKGLLIEGEGLNKKGGSV